MRSIASVLQLKLLCLGFCVFGSHAVHAGMPAASDADRPPTMMLSVTTEGYRQKNDKDQELDPNTWIREFFRQSLLMVAREEFGMLTRDGVLGEPIDEESTECFHLRFRSWRKGYLNLALRRGDRVLLETEL